MKTILISIVLSLMLSPYLASAASYSTDLEASSSQYWSISDTSQTGLNWTSNFTLSMWINLESGIPIGGDITVLIDKENVAGDKGYKWYLINVADTPQMRLDVNNGSNNAYRINSTFSTSTWYHTAVTWDASASTANFYINGLSIGTDSQSGTSITPAQEEPFRIGSDNSPNREFDGLINDIRVWSRKLSSNEISSLYSNPCTFNNGANLEGWWKFNNNGNDSSGNNNHLNNNNSATFTDDTPYSCDTPSSALPSSLFFSDIGILGNSIFSNSTSTEGIYLGKELITSNQKIKLIAPSSGISYIDFTKPMSEFLGRISFDNISGNLNLFAAKNITFSPGESSSFIGKVGIGTTSPNNSLTIQASSTSPFTIASSTVLFSIDKNGHIQTGGYTPRLSSCGSSATLLGDDTSGTITVGGNTNECVLNFGVSYKMIPHCVVSTQTPSENHPLSYRVTVNKITFSQKSLGKSKIDYICMGR